MAETKKELSAKLRRLHLAISQEIVHLQVLRHIPAVSNNHNLIAALDLSIYKISEALNTK
jgi:hypothetical protein